MPRAEAGGYSSEEWFALIERHRLAFQIASYLVVGAVALADWAVEPNWALGFLFIFPMIGIGALAPRWQIPPLALLCTILREQFGAGAWQTSVMPRLSMVFLAFLGAGFTSAELFRNRRLQMKHMAEIQHESELRREAEEQLRVLIESSPAAILTLNARQEVLLANEAAHRLFGLEQGTLPGRAIAPFLPDLTYVPTLDGAGHFRTAMECLGRTQAGEVFLASVWFSTYRTPAGPRLAAIINDVSENLRDREETSLEQMMNSSRVLIGAVSHEIRNFCAAIGLVRQNLAHVPELCQNLDFQALGTLVDGLGRIAGAELRHSASAYPGSVDLAALLNELRIIIEPPLRECGTQVAWAVPKHLPPVTGDRHSLMQVFLNLAKNSERAMQGCGRKELTISVAVEPGRVVVRVRDTGAGVPAPEKLFKPFQRGAEGSGLGLYVSRALMRAFRGELRYEPQESGCCFALELPSVAESERDEDEQHDSSHSNASDRRPYSLP